MIIRCRILYVYIYMYFIYVFRFNDYILNVCFLFNIIVEFVVRLIINNEFKELIFLW